MTQAAVEFDTREWDRFLKGVSKNYARARDILKETAKIFAFQDIFDHFRKEEGPDGAWAEWADSTKVRYAFLGLSGNKKLQNTGNMRQATSPALMRNEGADAVAVINNAPYANRHDQGFGRTPARPFMWLSESAHEKMAKAMLQMLLEERM